MLDLGDKEGLDGGELRTVGKSERAPAIILGNTSAGRYPDKFAELVGESFEVELKVYMMVGYVVCEIEDRLRDEHLYNVSYVVCVVQYCSKA